MSTQDYQPLPQKIFFFPKPPDLVQNSSQKWALEIGPGKGEFILDQAKKHSEINFIALEIRRFRYDKIAKKAQKMGLKNLYLVRCDARECLPRLFREHFFERIYILFPDPWPKKRHAKHRLFKPRLINLLERILKVKGEVYFASDAKFYAEEMHELFMQNKNFTAEPSQSLFPTYFESKWKDEGRECYYWKFIKN